MIPPERPVLAILLFAVGWVGHACVLTAVLNHVYGRALPKWFLRPYRQITAAMILAFPPLIGSAFGFDAGSDLRDAAGGLWGSAVLGYGAVCLVFGGVVFPLITVKRLLRRPPAALLAERTETVDYWRNLGPAAIGDGKHQWAVRLPFTCALRVDFTELTLAVPKLPAALDGLTVLLVSDVHFHGTPSRAFFERVFDKLEAQPTPDLVVFAGDCLDTDTHHDWIVPLLGRLKGMDGQFAVLGNHDEHHDPPRVRAELERAGFTVLSNRWTIATVRGVEVVVAGHEGPWFAPGPDLKAAPGLFRLCVSHTPDNFYWGQRNDVGLMLCGHVHGGQIRVPLIGPIFTPSVYGRRFDQGVFEGDGTVMVVGRGLGGKEPLRVRCHPQVLRLTLRARAAE